jgi:sulfur-oxidizing protein SoxY
MKRRVFLQGALASSAITALTSSGLLTPRSVLAAWPGEAFAAKDISQALELLLGSARTKPNSRDISMKLTPLADSGGSEVSVVIETNLADVESITLLVADSPTPLAASFRLGTGIEGELSTRLKIAKSGDILVVVKAGQRLYQQSKHVNLAECGCE